MYLLSNLLFTSNETTIKKVMIEVYNFICSDNIETIEELESNIGTIEVNNNFIERLLNTIIETDSETLYFNVISIYQ